MVESRMFQLSNPPFFRIKPPLINPHEVIVQSHKITMLDMCSRLTKSQPPFFQLMLTVENMVNVTIWLFNIT
jgi:hypothetical protein